MRSIVSLIIVAGIATCSALVPMGTTGCTVDIDCNPHIVVVQPSEVDSPPTIQRPGLYTCDVKWVNSKNEERETREVTEEYFKDLTSADLEAHKRVQRRLGWKFTRRVNCRWVRASSQEEGCPDSTPLPEPTPGTPLPPPPDGASPQGMWVMARMVSEEEILHGIKREVLLQRSPVLVWDDNPGDNEDIEDVDSSDN